MIDRRDFLKAGIATAIVAGMPPPFCDASSDKDASISSNSENAKSLPRLEHGYRHQYHKSLVYKIIIGCKDSAEHTLSLDEVAEVAKQTSAFTRGLKQIIYLVGWQFDGHDSKYPAWSEVNHRIKRQNDADARTSVIWLINEARKHNAFVGVHINVTDAYENSPLWQEYVDNDLIGKEADGSLRKGGLCGGERVYSVCKTREWQTGYTKRRIDALLELLPLTETGSVHLDAFVPSLSPGHGTTMEQELDAMAEMIKYWRSRGVDCTSEDINYRFVGLIPMALHLNLEERGRLKYPPQLLCGGGSLWNTRMGGAKQWYQPFGTPEPRRPEGGCLYEEAWGKSQDNDVHGLSSIPALAKEFYTKTLPWRYLNESRPVRLVETAEFYTVDFENGAKTSVRHKDRSLTLSHHGRVYVDGMDFFVPALWLDKECIAYSLNGCRKKWTLPPGWEKLTEVLMTQLYPLGDHKPKRIPVQGGKVELELAAEQAYSVTPA